VFDSSRRTLIVNVKARPMQVEPVDAPGRVYTVNTVKTVCRCAIVAFDGRSAKTNAMGKEVSVSRSGNNAEFLGTQLTAPHPGTVEEFRRRAVREHIDEVRIRKRPFSRTRSTPRDRHHTDTTRFWMHLDRSIGRCSTAAIRFRRDPWDVQRVVDSPPKR